MLNRTMKSIGRGCFASGVLIAKPLCNFYKSHLEHKVGLRLKNRASPGRSAHILLSAHAGPSYRNEAQEPMGG